MLSVAASVTLLAQSPLEQAVTLAREKRYAEAAQVLHGVPEPAVPAQRVAFHRLKAAVASGLGRAEEAADEMEAALLAAPEDQRLLTATAVAALAAKRSDAALAHAKKLESSAPVQELLGDIAEQRGDFVEASRAYQNAVSLAPNREEYRLRLALEFAQHYTFEPAIAVLLQAVPLFPKSARLRTLLGVTQYSVRQVPEAIEALTEAVQLDPSLEAAWHYLSTVVLDSTAAPPPNTVDALCRWDAVVCGAVQLRLARQQGDPALRAQAMEKLRSAPPGNPIALCELSRAYEWSEAWPEARRQMEACVAAEPSAQNHYRLGLIYSALLLPDLARQQMKLREEAVTRTADENARRRDAVQAFQYILK